MSKNKTQIHEQRAKAQKILNDHLIELNRYIDEMISEKIAPESERSFLDKLVEQIQTGFSSPDHKKMTLLIGHNFYERGFREIYAEQKIPKEYCLYETALNGTQIKLIPDIVIVDDNRAIRVEVETFIRTTKDRNWVKRDKPPSNFHLMTSEEKKLRVLGKNVRYYNAGDAFLFAFPEGRFTYEELDNGIPVLKYLRTAPAQRLYVDVRAMKRFVDQEYKNPYIDLERMSKPKLNGIFSINVEKKKVSVDSFGPLFSV